MDPRFFASAVAMGRLSPLALAMILVAGLLTPDALGSETKARIFQVDPLANDGFRLFATVLDHGQIPVPFEDLNNLEVFQLSSGGERIRLEYFVDGSPHVAKENTANPLSASDVGLDVVFIVSGSADRNRSEALNQAIRDAVLLMAKQLPANSRANLLWVTDTISLFVADPRKSGELTKLRSSKDWCRKQDKGYYKSLAENGSIVAEHPCGLLSDRSGLESALSANSASTAFDGFYPVLFGLPWRLCSATAQEPHELQDLVGQGQDEYVLQQLHTGALDVAISILTHYGRPGAVHSIIALVDGKDGYLLADDECQNTVAEDCAKNFSDEPPKKCSQRLIRQRLYGPQQMDFLEKVQIGLPLLHANRIRFDAIVLPTALAHEAERMSLLSLKSGGTPRVTGTEQEVIPAAEAAITELTGAYVVDIFPGRDDSDEASEQGKRLLGLQAELYDSSRERITIHTPAVKLVRDQRGGQSGGLYQKARSRLGEKVGASTANMILRGLALVLALLLVGIGLKIIRKIFSAMRPG